jgi:serine/threonine protein kinase
MALTPGTRLGSYEITSLLGSGAMGEVYRAKDLKLGRDVAIKVLREELASDPDRLRRFEQEARSASALNHPNIITIHDIGKHEATPYIAMEFVEGKTLRELLSEGPLPSDKLLRYAIQTGEGLAKAHSAGIVHRDLKPENLMVTSDGYVKILDFGLAKLRIPTSETDSEAATMTRLRQGYGEASPTGAGVILGTVGYMSPEQAKGQAADPRSDQFSFGTILYEMATGRRAFKRETSIQTLSAIIEREPESLDMLEPQLQAIVTRCLSKLPDDRYESTRDLVRELASVDTTALAGPRAPVSSTRGQEMVSVDGDDKVSIIQEGGSLKIQVEEGGERVHLEIPTRQTILSLVVITVAVLALLLGLNVCGLRDRLLSGTSTSPRIESLAVLPLENLSGDP